MTNGIDQQLTTTRAILRVAAGRCQLRLFPRRPRANPDFEHRLTMCLAEMGYGVYDAILQWYKQTLPDAQAGREVSLAQVLSEDLNVFFWPGYQSKLLDARLVLRSADGEPSGIGVRPDRLLGHLPRTYEAHPTTKLYAHALQRWRAGFLPGSTHEWIRAAVRREDSGRLAVLEVTRLPDRSGRRPDDWATVRVLDNKERRWAQTIRRELAAVTPIPWPSPHEDNPNDDVRLALYNIWLAGTFTRPILDTPALFNDLEPSSWA